ncbi:MAG: pro-sigmaK processing inhibitor BofA family protein [Oscillospiraceae bacterium]|nr:pro-sigmaK processing inhibitor BofA family protein [Oscillospiraceae bacterium]
MDSYTWILIAVAAIVLIFILVRSVAKPIGKILGIILHAALGYALLFLFNFFLGDVLFTLPLNLGTCLVAGIGGIPGVILLILFHIFF